MRSSQFARTISVVVATAAWFMIATSALAQRNLADVPDPDPELELKSFQVADGFEVNLFACDPQITKPVQMNFDARGRLWVVSSEIYPQIKPGEEAHDKVIVLEDADGDGRAEKHTVFAEGLLIPTGLEPGDGGVYVANSTELLHLRDTDGDGRADQRRVVLSGFGTEDTHHILHTFRWGPDGMLYFNQSIYIHSHVETPYGARHLNGSGIWQFRPETMQLEITARGFINPWGHHFDRWGQEFATDGAYGEGINYLIPGAAYASAVGVPKVLKGLNPGSPKHCGLEILGGSHLPEDWRGNFLTNDFRGHRVCRFVLSEDGAGYASREMPELIKTPHVAFRPIDIKMGPDGAIYIADWYNPIIQHGEVDFRDPRRDHTHGRIWRVTAKGRPLVRRPQLEQAHARELLESLRSSEDWTRHFAKRVLKERGSAVLPELSAWLKQLDANDPEYGHNRLEALWVYQSLDAVEPELLSTLLNSEDYRIRAAAVRVVPHWAARLPNPVALLAARVADEHARVRLEAVRALAKLPQPRVVELAMQALERPVDRFLEYALWLTAWELQPAWLPGLQSGELNFGGNSRQLMFALQAAGGPQVVKPLLESIRTGTAGKEREEGILTLVAAVGGPDDLGVLFELAKARSDARLLALLEQATLRRDVRPAGDLAALGELLNSADASLQEPAARLAGLWKLEALRPRLIELARGDKTGAGLRSAAFTGLAALSGDASRQICAELADITYPAVTRLLAIGALTSLDLTAAAGLAVDLLAEKTAGVDPAPLFAAFLEQRKGPAALVAALADRTLPEDAAKVGVRVVRNWAREEPALVDALTKAGQLKSGVQTLTSGEMERLAADVRNLGDPQRGEALFRRQDLGCFRCHAIGGAGGQIGPDLVSLGASAQIDYLIDSLLQPNKAVKENYHSLAVVNDQGKLFVGIKIAQTDKDLVLRTGEGTDLAIPLSTIEEQAPGSSLMPAGLVDPLTRAELADLVRFLSELGKVGPYAVGQARVVRRWQVLEPTPAAVSRLGAIAPAQISVDHPQFNWTPAYSEVAGSLPLAAIPRVEIPGQPPRGYVRCALDVSAAGAVALRLNGPAGVTLWLDGAAVPLRERTELNLAAGLRRLTFVVEMDQRREPLELELLDVAGSPARVQIVGGK